MALRWVLGTGAALGAMASSAVATGQPSAPGILATTVVFDVSRAVPIEGAVAFVEVRSPGGRLVVSRALQGSRAATVQLPAGSYRLSTYARTCDGSCEHLDPPTARCLRDVRILSGARVRARATIRWGQRPPCTLRLRR